MPIFQFTGLSGAGKTTLANATAQLFADKGIPIEIIDGDVYRKTICKDLGFSKEDRMENIRRLGLAAHPFSIQNKIVIISAINPYEEVRKELAVHFGAKTIYIKCGIDILTQRDTKGLYRRALLPDGHPDKLLHFTGINDRYEEPSNPDLVIETNLETIQASSEKIYNFILPSIEKS
ncbi:MAG: adenylyl-sulfate kinase [Bacteroidetes bacterium]|nr:adenylyl-sulfate kinase [Bacteroidota bacterium]